MTDRAEILANSAIAQIRALQREIQGLKNQLDGHHKRIVSLNDSVIRMTGEIDEMRDHEPSVLDALEGRNVALSREAEAEPDFPRHVPGTTGRGIQYELSDGTRINGGKVKALAAEARLHGA